MKNSTKKTMTGIAIAAAGGLVVNFIWSWFNGDEKVQEAKADMKQGKAA